MAIHEIELQVNTGSIPVPPTTTALIDANCSFKGNTNGVTNENFEIQVANGDTVTWIGTSSTTTNDSVHITEIDYESGTNLFGTTDLTPTVEHPNQVSGTISNATTTDAESYVIKFAVYNGSDCRGNYQIDPKLSMKT